MLSRVLRQLRPFKRKPTLDPDPATATALLESSIVWQFVGIFLCLAFSAVFSASETALTSIPSAKLRQLIDEHGYTTLKLWLDKPIPVLTAILIGNNVINVLASALATDLSNGLLKDTPHSGWAIPAAVGVTTLLLLTFGEITPKAIAKRMNVQIALFTIRMIKATYYAMYPIVWLFVLFTQTVMRMLGNDPNDQAPFVTYEEIEYLIELGSKEGTLSDDREKLLKSVVEFPDTLIREAMVPRTDTIALNSTISLEELLRIFNECGHSRLPVYQDSIDNILGIFYAKELIQILASNQDPSSFNLVDHLREVHFIPESKKISEQLAEFQRERIHIAVVVDEFGGTSGIITLEDIIEEFFGDILDEYDDENTLFESINETTIEADARLAIYEIEEAFDIEFPDHPEYDTLGGFLMASCGSVPKENQIITWRNLEFQVISADAKRVGSVRITKHDTDLTDQEE